MPRVIFTLVIKGKSSESHHIKSYLNKRGEFKIFLSSFDMAVNSAEKIIFMYLRSAISFAENLCECEGWTTNP